MRRVAILGSTGSIGRQTLEVIRDHPDRFQVVALAAGRNQALLAEQAAEFRPEWMCLGDSDPHSFPTRSQLSTGSEGLIQIIEETRPDVVVSAITGAAGLPANVRAAELGIDLALANKETLVMAGEFLAPLAARHGSNILPVDSEHSAIFQCLRAGQRSELSKVTLTASGGPFRGWSSENLAQATVEDALAHPTWNMGAKISIDSATLMNKALEVLEARILFDLEPSELTVVIHPESVVHSLVEFCDGSTIAHLGRPDMRVPIQYALSHPERWARHTEALSLPELAALHFEAPDDDTFPSLKLARLVWEMGGTAAIVFNAANEIAVERFLAKDFGFLRIFELIAEAVHTHEPEPIQGLEHIYAVDRSSRESARRWTP